MANIIEFFIWLFYKFIKKIRNKNAKEKSENIDNISFSANKETIIDLERESFSGLESVYFHNSLQNDKNKQTSIEQSDERVTKKTEINKFCKCSLNCDSNRCSYYKAKRKCTNKCHGVKNNKTCSNFI